MPSYLASSSPLIFIGTILAPFIFSTTSVDFLVEYSLQNFKRSLSDYGSLGEP